jgi:hypothetical protein
MIMATNSWKMCWCTYISIMDSLISILTSSMIFLKLWRLHSSIFTCRIFSSRSLILASYSKLFWNGFWTLSSVEFQKEDTTEAMTTRYLMTCFVMRICVIIDIGFPLVIRTFISCSCTIIFCIQTSLGRVHNIS